jgi:hypothetical protein
MASSSQPTSRRGHRFDKFEIGGAARAHLGDVYGDYHQHDHHEEGEEDVRRAWLWDQC